MAAHLAPDALENPVIVFDEHSECPDAVDWPVSLQYRQPSFTSLGFCPTPKGFRSLSDFRESRIHVSRALSLSEVPHPSPSPLPTAVRRSSEPPP
jgi:hypothetical protein